MLWQYTKSTIFIYFLLGLVFLCIVYLAYQQSWQYHLAVDIWGFYFPRFQHFAQNFSFASYPGNEYLPGAMFFFLFPGVVFTVVEQVWENYLLGLFLINGLLMTLHVIILRKVSWYGPILFLLISLTAGPMIIYRHELFVSIFIIISLILAQKNKILMPAFLLGVATTIKIYPAFIFPYLFIYFLNKYGREKAIKSFMVFIAGILFITLGYLLVGSVEEIKSALLINSIKPLHAESVWASFIELTYKISSGEWVPGKGANGIFGIDPNYIVFPLQFYNYFWIFPLSVFYFLLSKLKTKEFLVEIPFLIILLFIIFSKIVTPQYLLWAFLIYPLFKINKKKFLTNLAMMTLIGLTLIITQYLYPLNYSELLGVFFSTGNSVHLFYLLLLRNILLISIFIIVVNKMLSSNEVNK